jgi:four helix bundle protein
MQNPRNLRVVAHARTLASSVYRATAGFPLSERYGLTSQMRRAAISIGSNVSEGCGRNGDREFVQFLHQALGSAAELEFQSLVAADLGLLEQPAVPALLDEIEHAKLMLVRLIVQVRQRVAKRISSP